MCARLDDPRKVLCGAGTRGRFVPLTSAKDIDRPEIAALLKAAVRFGEIPMPASGRGRLVIKSVSAKQRPRRPTVKGQEAGRSRSE